MLQRAEDRNGLVAYRSPTLSAAGVPHLFTTRRDGTDRPFDMGELDRERTARLRSAVGVEVPVAGLHQVHGAAVHVARSIPAAPPTAARRAWDRV